MRTAEERATLAERNTEAAHAILTRAGIPSAVGAACDDPACISHLTHRLHVLVAERDEARADVLLAAGELMVPIPKPGTDEARIMLANVAMRRERDAANAELWPARARIAEATRLLRSAVDAHIGGDATSTGRLAHAALLALTGTNK